MKHTENTADRYISASKKGKFIYSDELKILEYLVKKFNLISQSEYARKESISVPAVKKRIENGQVMSIKIADRYFIIA